MQHMLRCRFAPPSPSLRSLPLVRFQCAQHLWKCRRVEDIHGLVTALSSGKIIRYISNHLSYSDFELSAPYVLGFYRDGLARSFFSCSSSIKPGWYANSRTSHGTASL